LDCFFVGSFLNFPNCIEGEISTNTCESSTKSGDDKGSGSEKPEGQEEGVDDQPMSINYPRVLFLG